MGFPVFAETGLGAEEGGGETEFLAGGAGEGGVGGAASGAGGGGRLHKEGEKGGNRRKIWRDTDEMRIRIYV